MRKLCRKASVNCCRRFEYLVLKRILNLYVSTVSLEMLVLWIVMWILLVCVNSVMSCRAELFATEMEDIHRSG